MTDRPSPRIHYDAPTLTTAVDDGFVRITAAHDGNYLADFSLNPAEARSMGQALIGFADYLEGVGDGD